MAMKICRAQQFNITESFASHLLLKIICAKINMDPLCWYHIYKISEWNIIFPALPLFEQCCMLTKHYDNYLAKKLQKDITEEKRVT